MVINTVLIKKNDATTNIILFLFSSFLIPKGITQISLKKLLELMKPFNKNESTVRMGLSRAVKSGILKNSREGDKVYYEIQDAGLKIIDELKEIRDVFWMKTSLKKNGWNNYWLLVNSRIPVSAEERNLFLNHLKKLGFGQLSRDCFAHPLNLSNKLEVNITELGLEEYIEVFMAKLCLYQNNSKIINQMWNIKEVEKEYLGFALKYSQVLSAGNTEYNTNLITFCHNFIYDFMEIMKIDPVLPNEFLGVKWEGETVLRMSKQFYNVVVPQTRKIVENIIYKPD